MTHTFAVHVYYEDTDLAGIVYYANYLKYIERARSEWVRALGVDQVQMKAEGMVFAVRRIEADYLTPARFDDDLVVTTTVDHATPARLVVRQIVARGDVPVFDALVTIVTLGPVGGPVRLPDVLRRLKNMG